MSSPATIGLTVLAVAIASTWVAIVIVFLNGCRKRSSLQLTADSDHANGLPKLSIVVAARNESECIETCIESLFRQDYPDFEVVAVNDRSTDETGEILDRLAEKFSGRMRVVHVKSLPAGWFGKPHALDAGMRVVTGDLVCFTDADCKFLTPSAFRATAQEMLSKEIDFISIAAKYTMDTMREAVIVPCCAEGLFAWLRPERVSDPRWPDAFANGAFIMTRRAPFERIGGWGSVRNKISEDLELARTAKRNGLRISVAQGESFYQTGSYQTWKESWNGWSRILQGVLTPFQLGVTLVRMVLLFVLPLAAMIWGLTLAAQTGSFQWFMQGAGLAFATAFFLRCVLDVIVFRLVGSPVAMIPLAPFGRLFMMCAITRALLSHAGLVKTHWRGASFIGERMVMPETVKA